MIELDQRDDRHIYYVDGVETISVTQVLEAAGLIDKRWYTPESAERGRYVHVATALDDRGGLVDANLRDDMRGYVEAWRRFRAESKCEVLLIEKKCYDPVYQYAGTFDRLLRLNAATTLADIKAGVPERCHALQTAAYAKTPEAQLAVARCAIYLHDDGTYSIKMHDHFCDQSVFLAALALANWKPNHGKGVVA